MYQSFQIIMTEELAIAGLANGSVWFLALGA
jgi:hypothetical protein